MPILAVHRSKELWGKDALEFRCVCHGIPCVRERYIQASFTGRSGGTTFRRRSHLFPASGATSSPFSAARAHASDTASRSPSGSLQLLSNLMCPLTTCSSLLQDQSHYLHARPRVRVRARGGPGRDNRRRADDAPPCAEERHEERRTASAQGAPVQGVMWRYVYLDLLGIYVLIWAYGARIYMGLVALC